MALSLENFFTVVKDGSWHNMEELSNKLNLPQDKLTELSRFLSEQGLAKYDEQENKIRLEPKWRLLLPEDERPTEPKTALAILIIPPDACVDVQSMQIRNLSGVELEISLRIDGKIRELAIKI
jgi:hypothetical protein